MLSHAALITMICALTILGFAAVIALAAGPREPAQQRESEPERGEVLLAA